MTINKVILLGNLGEEPRFKSSPGKKPVCVFSLATDVLSAVSDSKSPEWHRIVCFGTLAENCAKYLQKGREVYVEGQIQNRRWADESGRERFSNQIIAQTVEFIGSVKGSKEPFQEDRKQECGYCEDEQLR